MSFKEYVDDSHKDGTYVEYKLSEKSAENLKKFCEGLGINNILDPSTFHSTLVYSKTPCPKLAGYDFPTPIFGVGTHWSLFTTQKGGKCLVLEVDTANTLEILHDICVKTYGASHGFPEYKAHITISYDYDKKTVPTKVPTHISLKYDTVNVKPLDPDFDPTKAKNGE